MQQKNIILILLFFTSGIFYYHLVSPNSNLQTFQVIKIIDGDTIKLNNSQTIRLLGINTPEKNEPYHQEAKEFLVQKILNKTIQLEIQNRDKYGRMLGYIFLSKVNINSEILSQGLATLYYYEEDKYFEELAQKEEFARLNEIGLWKKSSNSNCLKLTNFEINEPESLTLQNLCYKTLDITYKDDATHIYKATIKPNSQYTKNFSHIWNTDKDSIYIYNKEGLILFYRYQN